jgi:Family of unknown function (DUF5947)
LTPVPAHAQRLRRLARRASAEREEQEERCELCSEPLPPSHRHLLDLESRELICACRACTLLFDRREAGGAHFRLVPDRRLLLENFALDDVTWARLRIPVEMAFFFHHSGAGRMIAFYPSPLGPTESQLELDAWEEIVEANPVLHTLEPDVEAVLVNRARGARRYFLVPIEEPYRLVGLIRTRWRGLSGGEEVWREIESFFDDLGRKSKKVTRNEEVTAWRT